VRFRTSVAGAARILAASRSLIVWSLSLSSLRLEPNGECWPVPVPVIISFLPSPTRSKSPRAIPSICPLSDHWGVRGSHSTPFKGSQQCPGLLKPAPSSPYRLFGFRRSIRGFGFDRGPGKERRTTVNHAMKSCRRAWYVADRRNPHKLPPNPFSKMDLRSSDKETPTATFAELQAFRKTAIEMGYPSLATAALIAWEWVPRKKNIFVTFVAEHYRPKEQPNSVRILHGKNEEENWIPLYDKDGPLYPELMAELDAIKRTRIAGVMIRRDKPPHDPWPTFPKNLPDFSHVEHTVKDIIRAAGLRGELSFTSFRHGGTTEAADGDATDAEMRALTRHRSAKVLPRYAKRTQKQNARVARKKGQTRGESEQ
jgi:hypothetical protein